MKRSVFDALRRYIVERGVEEQKWALAITHRNRTIARTVLEAWYDCTAASNRKVAMWRVAVRYRYLRLVGRVWKGWNDKLLMSYQAKIKWRRATVRHRRMVKQRCFDAWKVYAQTRSETKHRIRQLLYERCVRYYELYFRLWRVKAVVVREIREKAEVGRREREAVVVREIFTEWKAYAHNRATIRRKEAEVIWRVREQLDRSKLRNTLSAWIDYCRAERHLAYLRKRADTFHARGLYIKAFVVWTRLLKHRRWEKSTTQIATAFRTLTLQRTHFTNWHRKRTDWKTVYDLKYTLPVVYWGTRTCRGVFAAWRGWAVERRRLRGRIEDAEMWRKERVLREGGGGVFKVRAAEVQKDFLKAKGFLWSW
ncbi:hypothetical protein HK097_011423 [Rhizophlyctis rosea]|uniref:Sfi1 spindle body domain-containing protein n=1 Tax=Rhizophlyctis rosea TaxID=64517 RepID=A0AAD5S972_9FUNG|nr:hypothetical protein HK097_011423 [Rhizophlyctis rosea]